MFARNTLLAPLLLTIVGLAAAQNTPSSVPPSQPVATAQATTPPRKSVTFGDLVDRAIRQERRMTELMRYSKPIVETYVQQQKHDSDLQTSPKADDYFLSRLDVSAGDQMDREFANPKKAKGKKSSATAAQSFSAGGFALAAFPDLDHFDRQNYKFEFVRWEILGDVRCAVINVEPAEGSQNRRFLGRIWVEDEDFNIVRFTGEFAAKEFSKRCRGRGLQHRALHRRVRREGIFQTILSL